MRSGARSALRFGLPLRSRTVARLLAGRAVGLAFRARAARMRIGCRLALGWSRLGPAQQRGLEEELLAADRQLEHHATFGVHEDGYPTLVIRTGRDASLDQHCRRIGGEANPAGLEAIQRRLVLKRDYLAERLP